MTTVGYSFWGFCEKFRDCDTANTPDGNRYGRPILVDALKNAGHDVIALQKRREKTPYENILAYASHNHFPALDVLLIEWRWKTYKNDGGELSTESDWKRQCELLDHYHGKIPIVAWDTDLKMTEEDEKRWPKMVIADPTLNPQTLTRRRQRLTFWTDFIPLFDGPRTMFGDSGPYDTNFVKYGYVGNNYERDDMFKRYYSDPADSLRKVGVQTNVYGNWLQRSPERESPETIIAKYPNIAFVDRVGFNESMKILSTFICSTHITKERYAKQGFVSPRYLESIVCGTPALVPVEFLRADLLGQEWIVESSQDIHDKVIGIKATMESYFHGPERCRNDIVNDQKKALQEVHDFSVNSVVEMIESFARNQTEAMKNL